PPTIITEDTEKAYDVVQHFGKSVFKPLYSTKARGMMVIEANNGAKKDIQDFKTSNPVMYIQKMITLPGKDLGITFLGGDYLGTYARVRNKGSWNTTIHSGGKYEAYKPSQEMIDLAHKAQSLFGLDFTCVDVVETDEGPKVFEVSAFGGFRGLLEACDIDVAKLYTDYVLRRLDHD
ncbi:MAG TPA: ATP-grasp family protein, partial [Spirochaetes bacterium]|nr:ATP-grasp family protein [Spirochaetota bacterium]